MNEITLNRDNLTDLNATFALGSLVASELYRTGQAFIFFNVFNEVQLASKEDVDITPPLPILMLDTLPVTNAIEKLLEAKTTEAILCDYLQGRDSRVKSSGN